MTSTLHYVHDPMCSWCWAFSPTFDSLVEQLPASVQVNKVLGGLAPDSDAPMPEALQQMLQQTWQRISTLVPGTMFNFDFWTNNQPRRSTWPACRAVLAAANQDALYGPAMVTAIQHAYYLNAKNPSDKAVLCALAAGIGCNLDQFSQDMDSPQIHQLLIDNITFGHRLGAQGFPSLFLEVTSSKILQIPVNYTSVSPMLAQIGAQLVA